MVFHLRLSFCEVVDVVENDSYRFKLESYRWRTSTPRGRYFAASLSVFSQILIEHVILDERKVFIQNIAEVVNYVVSFAKSR